MSVVNKKEIYISKRCYAAIVSTIAANTPETGGILGIGKEGMISEFVYDEGNGFSECYIPNTKVLNDVILDWKDKGIRFCGIIHSHSNNRSSRLSESDIEYGYQILNNMSDLKEIYMPIVNTDTNNYVITAYVLRRNNKPEKVILKEI